MSAQITKAHLQFLNEALETFENNPLMETYRNKEGTLIALRYGTDRDCIDIYDLGGNIGFFAQIMERELPLVTKDDTLDARPELRWFAGEMEKTLKANDHKGGWHQEGTAWLYSLLQDEVRELGKAIDSDHEHVIKEATDVANFAMMIADKARRCV